MIKLIQLKQVVTNKRFLLFTLFIPITWYILLYNLQGGLSPNIMLGIAVFIGIIGNSLGTFSKRISSNINFYAFEAKFTKYSLKSYLVDQSIVQIVLNALIFISILCVASIFFHFAITANLVIQFFLLTMMGIYFSIIGFVLGVRLDSMLLDTISFPVIILAAMTIVPFSLFNTGSGIVNLISKIEMIFPGYYYTNIISDLYSGRAINMADLYLFVLVFILNIIPLYLLINNKR